MRNVSALALCRAYEKLNINKGRIKPCTADIGWASAMPPLRKECL